ncbi:NAD(P)-binding domain-containing protein [Rhodobacterales bacterium HKCCE3408]|nr:NAD(P)-binding domain-containing protein [Rhodobacterales bacterium HKCCE3408]
MASVGFIGTGHIAAPMARLAARNGHEVTVSRRSEDVSSDLAAAGLGIGVAENQEVVDASEIIVLSLRPAVWRDIASGLSFRADQRIVSVMAGVPRDDIAAACAPVTDISLTIPYGHLEHGGCPLPIWPGPEPVETLWGGANPVLPLGSEDDMTHVFHAGAVTSGVLMLLEAAARQMGEATGDAATAETYLTRLVGSYLLALPPEAGAIGDALSGLATPSTLNNTMLQHLRDAGADKAVAAAIDAMARGDLR